MTRPLNRAIERTVGVEGDYSDNPNDSGGKTRFGITEAVARANGYTGDMRSLPFAKAVEIYKSQYWDTLRLDQIAAASEPIALELFDTAVNLGVGVAGRFLQRSLNAFNRSQKDYQDVKVDGVVGPVTVYSLKSFLALRGNAGERVLFKSLNGLQAARYVELAELREKDEAFVFGWIKQRVEGGIT